MGAYTRKQGLEFYEDLERVYALFPRVKERLNQIAGTLSGGEQQMVAIGRALMARPRLICMDEPSMGLSPLYVEQVFTIIQEINRQGTTVFMVEQNANLALSIANRAYVLQTGKVVLSGPAQELRRNPAIQEAYLGELGVVQTRITPKTRNPFTNRALSVSGVTRKLHFLNHAVGPSALQVLHALIFDFLNYTTGRLDLSYKAIARQANLCERAVADGLKRAPSS